jgi:hypothetical protein
MGKHRLASNYAICQVLCQIMQLIKRGSARLRLRALEGIPAGSVRAGARRFGGYLELLSAAERDFSQILLEGCQDLPEGLVPAIHQGFWRGRF